MQFFSKLAYYSLLKINHFYYNSTKNKDKILMNTNSYLANEK